MDLVQRAVNERKAPISRATVVNFKAPQEYFEEIEDLLKPREMRRFNTGFADLARTVPPQSGASADRFTRTTIYAPSGS
jgi:hypothetical protein